LARTRATSRRSAFSGSWPASAGSTISSSAGGSASARGGSRDRVERGRPTNADSLEIVAAKLRLDLVLVDRGLAPSRERGRGLILVGRVSVDGQVVSKAGAPVA